MTIQPSVCIALDGDKLKPREDQRKGGNGFDVNEDGAGYTLTGVDRHGVAYGMDARNTGLYGAGATGEEVSMTQDANQCKGGKCVVQFYENDTLNHSEVCRTLTGNHDDRVTDTGTSVVISTNSNGGDVAPTLTLELARQTGAQQANGGGVRHQQEGLTSRPSAHTAAEKSQAR